MERQHNEIIQLQFETHQKHTKSARAAAQQAQESTSVITTLLG